MVGTLYFSVTFTISLIEAQRRADLTAVKLTGKLFHVWTLCNDSALSTCLFPLLLNTYLCDKRTLNTGADRDEKHRRAALFSPRCVKLRASYLECRQIEERQRWLEMRRSVLHGLSLSNPALHSHGHVQYGGFGKSIEHSANHQERNT